MTLDRFALPPGDGRSAVRLCLAQRLPAGDPVQLRAAAHRSSAFAAEVRRSTAMLLAATETELWRGPAHRAFTDQLRAHAPTLTATADRYDDYAVALAGYAGALDEVAAPLGALHRQLQQASDELAARPGTADDPAARLLPLAQTFKARYDQWADALDHCIRALVRAGDRDPTRDLHGWQAFARHVGHLAVTVADTFERAVLHPSLSNISACLGELNAGLSMLGIGLLFIYPPAGAACLAVATVLAVAQLAVDSTRRAHGEQVSNTSLGFEVAATIPLGGNALRSLKVADDVVHLVPGGGLAAHEAAGGHTLARHVDKPESYLRHRLTTEPHITAASTFYDREVAEESIHELIAMHDAPIARWLADGSGKLVLEGSLPRPIGILIIPGSATTAPGNGIRVILRRSRVTGTGFYIHTAMVTK